MTDRKKVMGDLEGLTFDDWRMFHSDSEVQITAKNALQLLKEQEHLKLKMWNALYAEEDKLERKFIGTEKHDDWFNVYRPWLQRGFEIAITVIAEQDGV